MTGIMNPMHGLNHLSPDLTPRGRGPFIVGSEPIKPKMEYQNFCYWLQGFFEVGDPRTLDEKQVEIIKDHLQLVFNKETPDRSGGGYNTNHFINMPFEHNVSC